MCSESSLPVPRTYLRYPTSGYTYDVTGTGAGGINGSVVSGSTLEVTLPDLLPIYVLCKSRMSRLQTPEGPSTSSSWRELIPY